VETHFHVIVLQKLCQTPLYKSVKISMRPSWQDSMEQANTNEIIELEKKLMKIWK
jgi:hypothetical protein